MKINTGQKLWSQAKKVIPGGNQLLSKRAEMFLPDLWPAYCKKAKGCEVWDLDNNHYYDFAGMGVTACVLGYADSDVNHAVKIAIDNGSMATLNCSEEVALAEKLVDLHPWSDMARFARTGGEACAIAVRIARAASGKDNIAFCGYHGWHDWYLSANLSDKQNLNSQLLPGLSTDGVPSCLNSTTHPFYYNDVESFDKVIAEHGDKIGVIIMEPQRAVPPKSSFLQHIRKIASEKNMVLVFDEVTSAFHDNLGGKHLTLGVNPDVAIFAKAMGNGYPISAVVGTRAVMDAAQDTFISSTMWTEKIGFVAALATIEKMQYLSVQKKLIDVGVRMKKGWACAAESAGLQVNTSGLDSIPYFSFDYDNKVELLTFFNQEMLARGFLATAGTATTIAYTDDIVDKYLNNCEQVFYLIKKNNLDVAHKLKGPLKHTSFARLTG
jgi:glutamate-1-semialdehyde 2,1-aminomutase